MARPEKVAVVEEIKERLESAEAVFVTEYRGLTVGQQQELRRSLRAAEAEYKVFKMTLARRAAEEAGFEDLLVWLEGPTAIAFTSGDPVPTAKSLKEFADSNDRLVLKGGLLAGATLDAEAVRKLAEIEPREVLLAKLAGAMAAPMSKLAGLMTAMLREPLTAMQQLLEKKEADPSLVTPAAAEEPADEPEAAADEPEVEEPATEAEEPPADAEEPAAEAEAESEPAEAAAEEPAAEAPAAEAEPEEAGVEDPAAEADEEEAAAEEPEVEEPAAEAEEPAADAEAPAVEAEPEEAAAEEPSAEAAEEEAASEEPEAEGSVAEVDEPSVEEAPAEAEASDSAGASEEPAAVDDTQDSEEK